MLLSPGMSNCWEKVSRLWLHGCSLVLVVQLNSTWVWMRFSPLNQRIWPRRSSLSAQSISSSSSASSSPSSSLGSRPSPASFKHGNRSVGTVAITFTQVTHMERLSGDEQTAQQLNCGAALRWFSKLFTRDLLFIGTQTYFVGYSVG